MVKSFNMEAFKRAVDEEDRHKSNHEMFRLGKAEAEQKILVVEKAIADELLARDRKIAELQAASDRTVKGLKGELEHWQSVLALSMRSLGDKAAPPKPEQKRERLAKGEGVERVRQILTEHPGITIPQIVAYDTELHPKNPIAETSIYSHLRALDCGIVAGLYRGKGKNVPHWAIGRGDKSWQTDPRLKQAETVPESLSGRVELARVH